MTNQNLIEQTKRRLPSGLAPHVQDFMARRNVAGGEVSRAIQPQYGRDFQAAKQALRTSGTARGGQYAYPTATQQQDIYGGLREQFLATRPDLAAILSKPRPGTTPTRGGGVPAPPGPYQPSPAPPSGPPVNLPLGGQAPIKTQPVGPISTPLGGPGGGGTISGPVSPIDQRYIPRPAPPAGPAPGPVNLPPGFPPSRLPAPQPPGPLRGQPYDPNASTEEKLRQIQEYFARQRGGAQPGPQPDLFGPEQIFPQSAQTGGGGMPQLLRPATQYQARMGPTALQQYYGYQQAQQGARPEETRFRRWSEAPPTGQFAGLSFRR